MLTPEEQAVRSTTWPHRMHPCSVALKLLHRMMLPLGRAMEGAQSSHGGFQGWGPTLFHGTGHHGPDALHVGLPKCGLDQTPAAADACGRHRGSGAEAQHSSHHQRKSWRHFPLLKW